MKLLRNHPFLLLAVLTVVIGAIWHSPLIADSARPALAPTMEFIGAPFIVSMRFMNRTLGPSGVSRLLGTLLGLAPYLLADLLLRRWRLRNRSRSRDS